MLQILDNKLNFILSDDVDYCILCGLRQMFHRLEITNQPADPNRLVTIMEGMFDKELIKKCTVTVIPITIVKPSVCMSLSVCPTLH